MPVFIPTGLLARLQILGLVDLADTEDVGVALIQLSLYLSRETVGIDIMHLHF